MILIYTHIYTHTHTHTNFPLNLHWKFNCHKFLVTGKEEMQQIHTSTAYL